MKLWMQLAAATLANLLRRLANKLSPLAGLDGKIAEMLASQAFEAVMRAVRKQNADQALASALPEVKRAEALEWAQHYGGKKLARSDAWETRFLMELAVGLEKGKLPKE